MAASPAEDREACFEAVSPLLVGHALRWAPGLPAGLGAEGPGAHAEDAVGAR
jgi:hypothetical protein